MDRCPPEQLLAMLECYKDETDIITITQRPEVARGTAACQGANEAHKKISRLQGDINNAVILWCMMYNLT
jgi:hypothetical protein